MEGLNFKESNINKDYQESFVLGGNIRMYDMYGFDPISEKDLLRYEKGNLDLDSNLSEIAERGIFSQNIKSRIAAIPLIKYASVEKQKELSTYVIEIIENAIDSWEQGLIDDDMIGIVVRAVRFIPSDVDRAIVINRMLYSGNQESGNSLTGLAIEMIDQLPKEKRADFVFDALIGFNDSYLFFNICSVIEKVPQGPMKDRILEKAKNRIGDTLLEAQLNPSKAADVIFDLVRSIRFMNESVRSDLFLELSFAIHRSLLHESGFMVYRYFIPCIKYMPSNLADNLYAKAKQKVIEEIEKTTEKEGMDFPVVDMIGHFEISTQFELFNILINKALSFPYSPFFQDRSSRWYKTTISIISTWPVDVQKVMIEEFSELLPKKEEIKNIASTTRLYDNVGKEKFFKAKLDKTGSGTTLLGNVPGNQVNSLKDRVIVRHIDVEPYLAWRKAFESADFWKSKGFDYVPVEPIVKVSKDADNPTDVSVFTRVLVGPTVLKWKHSVLYLFHREIKEKVFLIREALKELGIDHGHHHLNNFCLSFQRDEDGEVDVTKPPRVYIIDFDRALLSSDDKKVS